VALSHSPKIVTDGLVLCLDAGNTKSYPGSGTTWTDLSGNGNTGTLVNGVGYGNGYLSFDGSNDYVSVALGSNIAFGTNPFSVEFWVRFNSGFPAYLFDTRSTSKTTTWALFINGSGKLEWYTGSTSYFYGDSSNPTWSGDSGWRHIVVSRENTSSNGIKLYINSSLISQTTDTTNYSTSSAISYVGCRYTFTEFLSSNFSVFRIYKNKALTASEIQQNFNTLRGRFGI
jgi:hypothetical protein